MNDADRKYRELQATDRPERAAGLDELRAYSGSWKNASLPALQGQVVDLQLANLREGVIDPVFAALIRVLAMLPENDLSVLDAACASGYYSEVIHLAKPGARYAGSDYSIAMIREARHRYPDRMFWVANACRLTLAARSFDCVLLSGALEHIPDYEAAICEICRVARRYVILHRLPVTLTREVRFTLGTQYRVDTPRIFFPQREIVKRMRESGFGLRAERAVYAGGLRHEISRRLHRRHPDTRTLLFTRSA